VGTNTRNVQIFYPCNRTFDATETVSFVTNIFCFYCSPLLTQSRADHDILIYLSQMKTANKCLPSKSKNRPFVTKKFNVPKAQNC
jgi:hypothetical protein